MFQFFVYLKLPEIAETVSKFQSEISLKFCPISHFRGHYVTIPVPKNLFELCR